jgi:hypothetical protein
VKVDQFFQILKEEVNTKTQEGNKTALKGGSLQVPCFVKRQIRKNTPEFKILSLTAGRMPY